MSADNWAICPKCVAAAQEAAEARIDAAATSYGKVPVEVYERLRAEAAESDVDPEDFRTFREDYEFYGVEEGTLHIDYSGHCTVCSCGLDFKDERKFFPDE